MTAAEGDNLLYPHASVTSTLPRAPASGGYRAELGRSSRYGQGQALVARGDREKQRPRSGKRGVHQGQPAEDRRIAETLCRAQPSAQEQPVSIGDVDADLLHQPRGQEPAEVEA